MIPDRSYTPISPIILPTSSEFEEFLRKWREWHEKEFLSILGIPAEYFKTEMSTAETKARIIENIRLDNVSLVRDPINERCRIAGSVTLVDKPKEAGMNWRGLFMTVMLMAVGAFSAWQVLQVIWGQAVLLSWTLGLAESVGTIGSQIDAAGKVLLLEILASMILLILIAFTFGIDNAPGRRFYGWVCKNVEKKSGAQA